MDCTVYETKTKALISFTVQLWGYRAADRVLFGAYLNCKFSQDIAHIMCLPFQEGPR